MSEEKKKPISTKQSPKKAFFAKKYMRNIKHPRLLAIFLFVIIFASIGTYWYTNSRAAGTATLSLSPATLNIGLSSTLVVTIQENSTDLINAVQADLIYDKSKLQFVSIDTTVGPFSTVGSTSGGDGKVSIGIATTTAVSGLRNVAKVTFTTIGAGTTTVSFANTSAIVRASDQVNVLGTMTGATYIIDGTAPTVPTNLTATSDTASSVTLNWTASTDNVGVTGYRVYRGGTLIGTSNSTTYRDTGRTLGTTYSYTISAVDAAGNASAQTSAVSCTVVDKTAPSVPTGLTASTASSTSIRLSWNASTDNVAVTGYKIYRSGTQIGTSTTTTYTDTGRTLGTTYTYTVAANDAAGNTSAQSTSISYKIEDVTPPSVPTGINMTSRTPNSISFSWTASTDNIGVTGYRIYRNGTQIGTSTGTSYTDSGLTMATAYSYSVAANDAAGNISAQSAAVSLTTVTKKGDINGDNLVNVTDLSILASNYGKSGMTWSQGDIYANNGIYDGIVNIFDLSVLAANWGL